MYTGNGQQLAASELPVNSKYLTPLYHTIYIEPMNNLIKKMNILAVFCMASIISDKGDSFFNLLNTIPFAQQMTKF
jgi:hypothetical protein